MIRSWREKDQLVRKFEEIVPFLKTQQNFGWIIPDCGDPWYAIYPENHKPFDPPFKQIVLNIKTGWHSSFVYKDETGVYREPEGITPVSANDWRDECWRSNCACKLK